LLFPMQRVTGEARVRGQFRHAKRRDELFDLSQRELKI